MTRRKRGYSKEFPTGAGRKMCIDAVPAGLLRAAKAKARREGISLRVAALRWLTAYVAAS